MNVVEDEYVVSILMTISWLIHVSNLIIGATCWLSLTAWPHIAEDGLFGSHTKSWVWKSWACDMFLIISCYLTSQPWKRNRYVTPKRRALSEFYRVTCHEANLHTDGRDNINSILVFFFPRLFSRSLNIHFFLFHSPFICKLYRYCKITRGMKRSAQ
jgi:hypothetical protein